MGVASGSRVCSKVVRSGNQRLRDSGGGLLAGKISTLNRAAIPLPKLGPVLPRVRQHAYRDRPFSSVAVKPDRWVLCRMSEGPSLLNFWQNAKSTVVGSSPRAILGPAFPLVRQRNNLNFWQKAKSTVVGKVGIDLRQVAAASGGSGSAGAVPRRSGIFEFLGFYGKCYYELSKGGLSFFVVTTAAVGFVMGSGELLDWVGLGWTSVGTMLAASSANAFNQILEVTNDGQMKRTMRRPLPGGRMSIPHALVFALTAGISGVTLLACKTTPLAAELGAANLLLYALVYTPLKQIHYVNTWVGAVVGAIPPLMGWAAATGRVDDARGWVLASTLYFWQIPHFMAIAFLCRHDYAAGGYKMLSLLDVSGQRTAVCALRNSVYLLPLGFLAQHWGTTSGYFGVEHFMITAIMVGTSLIFYFRPSVESARQLFRSSLLYLPIVMSAMVVHRIPNSERVIGADSALHGKLLLPDGVLDAPPDDEVQLRAFQHGTEKKKSPLPPVSSMSVAPFPFLPAPDYCYRGPN